MRKFRLLLTILLSTIFAMQSVMAERISQEKALQIATAFMKNSSSTAFIAPNMKVFKTSEDFPDVATKVASNPYFYIITNQNGKGFVIVSADNYTEPILGYSLESDLNEIPKNMEYWLAFLRDQIIRAKEKGFTDTKAQENWNKNLTAGTPVKELGTALWNQTDPYYLQCPKKGSQYCVTGCVATAIAEVMRYFEWPKSGTGYTQEYTCSDESITVISRNLNHEYLWDKMPLAYTSGASSEQKQAVATLMADIGAAYQLDYGTDGTSGAIIDGSLVNNFGYNSNLYLENRSNYTDDNWVELLKSEINKNRPLVYSGQDESKKAGHAFVLDGYDNENFFHVNWGWGGYGNGYFLVSALNISGYKFNSGQEVLFNFYPTDGGSSNPQGLNLYKPGIQCSATSFNTGQAFTIQRITIANLSTASYSGVIGVMLTDKSGNIIEELSLGNCNLDPYYIAYVQNLSITISKEIKPGYRIRTFHKPTGEEIWYPMWREGVSSDIKQEILVAEDIDTPLEDATSLYYNKSTKQIIVTTLEGVTSTVYDNAEVEINEGVTKENNIITIDLTKLTTGKYKLKLQKNTEVKELHFSVKPIK